LFRDNDAIPCQLPREEIGFELGGKESREVDMFGSTDRKLKRAEKSLRQIATDEKRERVGDCLKQFFHDSVPRIGWYNDWVLKFAVAEGIESEEFTSDVEDAVPDDNKLPVRARQPVLDVNFGPPQ
jgi:hypothetical protein